MYERIDAKILCKGIDINNIVSIKLIVYGLLYIRNSVVVSCWYCEYVQEIIVYLQTIPILITCHFGTVWSKHKVEFAATNELIIQILIVYALQKQYRFPYIHTYTFSWLHIKSTNMQRCHLFPWKKNPEKPWRILEKCSKMDWKTSTYISGHKNLISWFELKTTNKQTWIQVKTWKVSSLQYGSTNP